MTWSVVMLPKAARTQEFSELARTRLEVVIFPGVALKRPALPPELIAARAKRLRFLMIITPGKLVHHARHKLLQLGHGWLWFIKTLYREDRPG